MTQKTVFTVGETAKICGVAPKTIQKWFDEGRLRGYRVPGSQKERRIIRESLVTFMREHSMPLNKLDDGRYRILVVSCEFDMIARLRELLPEDRDFQLDTAGDCLVTGYKLATFTPHVAVIDLAIGRREGIAIAGYLRPETMRIALGSEDESESVELMAGFNHVLFRPFDVAVLAELIVKSRDST